MHSVIITRCIGLVWQDSMWSFSHRFHIVTLLCSRQNSVNAHKKARNLPVVRHASRGSCIAYWGWTGNVTANADMNNRSITQSSRYISKTLKQAWRFSIWLVLLLGYLYKQLYCARKVRSVLIRSTQEWYDHTQDIYRCLAQDQNPICCKIRLVSNTTSSERLHYV